MTTTGSPPDISVVILNYNGKRWLPRCLASLREQTCWDRMEVIVADNASQDGSDLLSQELLAGWPRARFAQNGGNLGYCEGNNRGAKLASGRYLFFLNNDTWLAPNCLALLVREMDARGAGAGSPQVLNYQDGALQGYGRSGFDSFGYYSPETGESGPPRRLFISPGCAYCIRADLFDRLGGFDAEFFMYADETDLSWRVWVAGESVICVPEAKLYHWGAGASAPVNSNEPPRFRTSVFSRFHSNRNTLLVLLKSAENLLLILVVTQLFSLAAEMVFMTLATRNLALARKAYFGAVADVWRLRGHVARERSRLRALRRRSDFWMLRFWRPFPERALELIRVLRQGLPRV
ncbi:MAG: glycosyltransferase family 2 protein [Verrucomicrobia bacterium]|nr:glycosyltransferase family 2 protein [Verrucomicrobiota bacterium]MBI3868194.1 glycosyltransferase family 2 protein [Verrucomicrobiota bacterium]